MLRTIEGSTIVDVLQAHYVPTNVLESDLTFEGNTLEQVLGYFQQVIDAKLSDSESNRENVHVVLLAVLRVMGAEFPIEKSGTLVNFTDRKNYSFGRIIVTLMHNLAKKPVKIIVGEKPTFIEDYDEEYDMEFDEQLANIPEPKHLL